MNENKTVRAVFAYVVNSADDNTDANDGVTTLREAINKVNGDGGGTIIIDPSLERQTITLANQLPTITQSIAIDGNGITVSGNKTYKIMYISVSGITATIRRVHFKDGKDTYYGGAIQNNNATLNLQSCIFSGNHSTYYGGAIYNSDVLNIQGCTFYNNRANRGGAIYNYGIATLAGNVFYGNTAVEGDIIYNSYGAVASDGYNVYDDDASSNFFNGTGDKPTSALPFTPVSFRSLDGSVAANALISSPSGYPTVDFYGDPISAVGAAGAVQGEVVEGFWLDYGYTGSGTVAVTDGSVDPDGIVTKGATIKLTATPDAGLILLYWTVNGVVKETQDLDLQVTMNENKTVRAVFAYVVNSVEDNTTVDGYTTLREAIQQVNSDGGGGITFDPSLAGQTIMLASQLPTITQSLTIEGNGVTVSGGKRCRIMYINEFGITVTIRLMHFKDG
jgi:CSLREA domain-containing protein